MFGKVEKEIDYRFLDKLKFSYAQSLGEIFVYRADEEAFVADRDDSSTPGHDWERVCRNCDFNPKGTKNTKDVSRMRSIFLQLKQTPLVKD